MPDKRAGTGRRSPAQGHALAGMRGRIEAGAHVRVAGRLPGIAEDERGPPAGIAAPGRDGPGARRNRGGRADEPGKGEAQCLAGAYLDEAGLGIAPGLDARRQAREEAERLIGHDAARALTREGGVERGPAAGRAPGKGLGVARGIARGRAHRALARAGRAVELRCPGQGGRVDRGLKLGLIDPAAAEVEDQPDQAQQPGQDYGQHRRDRAPARTLGMSRNAALWSKPCPRHGLAF